MRSADHPATSVESGLVADCGSAGGHPGRTHPSQTARQCRLGRRGGISPEDRATAAAVSARRGVATAAQRGTHILPPDVHARRDVGLSVSDSACCLTSDTRVCFNSPDSNVRLREGNAMHGKTRKANAATAGAHSPQTAAHSTCHHRFRHGHAPTEAVGGSKLVLLAVLLVAQLMVILDITAVNIALPSLSRDLDISGSSISWTITSYSLIFGSLLLFGGRAADLLGRRRMFLTGLGIFTVSSFASAMAGSAGALFAARAGQGLGAAMLSPAALAIIMSAFQGTQRT